MYDGVVTPEFMDDYGQVQNGDYPGQGYGNRYVVKVKGHESCHKPYSMVCGVMDAWLWSGTEERLHGARILKQVCVQGQLS